ncbi:hypothetical protein FG386_000041 [Cryptosporidium ryanae]|uniref:uncharacterized protein n=1 Tax=Cryptosporidium ryanae TaxID=515981 RepID=UPI00351A6E89|nr:hypothetical protein FG386_000041 [Cryptosporidium ryanae]
MKVNKKDAIEAVKKYFEDSGLNIKLRWEDAAKLIGEDAPHHYLNSLSTGEKRQLWSEYQSQSKKKQRGKERQNRTDSTDMLNNSIKEWVLNNIGCNNLLRFQDFASNYYQQNWWKYISDSEKNEIFQEMVEYNEKRFFNEVKCEYNNNSNNCLSLLDSDTSIFPTVNEKGYGLFKLTLNKQVIKQLNSEIIWNLIYEKYSSENFFNKLYRDDILKIYIKLFKEKLINKEKELTQLIDNKMVKYRKFFWELIKEDILSGNIGPITNTRKSYFVFPEKNAIEKDFYDSLIKMIKKKVNSSNYEYKKDIIFEDFIKFISFHISNKRNQKILLFLLRHTTKDGEYIYCVEMFYYILELLQEVHFRISSQFSDTLKNSNVRFSSFQHFKRYFMEKTDFSLPFKKLKYPLEFGSIIDKILYILYSNELFTK